MVTWSRILIPGDNDENNELKMGSIGDWWVGLDVQIVN